MRDQRDEASTDARYWRARARAAEADASRLRALVRRLARVLPLEHALLLERTPDEIPDLAHPSELLLGYDPVPRLEPAEPLDDLARLWRELATPDER